MTKATYALVNNKIYRVLQTVTPCKLSTLPAGCTAALSIDSVNKEVTEIVKINTLNKHSVKSNAQLYKDLVTKLTDEKITEITDVQNYFKIYIDYTVYEDGHEEDHSAVIQYAEPNDNVVLLGLTRESELVYRHVKQFSYDIEFAVQNDLPYGIMRTHDHNYTIKINSIVLFEDLHAGSDYHKSQYNHCYKVPSASIETAVEDMVVIYNSEKNIDIAPIELSYIPRKVCIKLELLIANYVDAYSKADIDSILLNNIKNKYDDSKKDDDDKKDDDGKKDDDTPETPADDTHPKADDKYTPDDNGWFDFYEKCTKTTPHALRVVEDIIPDDLFNKETMVKKSTVIEDIQDVAVGDYVVYRESFVFTESLL